MGQQLWWRGSIPTRGKLSARSGSSFRLSRWAHIHIQDMSWAQIQKQVGTHTNTGYEVVTNTYRGQELGTNTNIGHEQALKDRFTNTKQKLGRDGVIIIPPTPKGVLAKALKKACQEELKNTGISLSVHERGGKQLGHVLGTTQPGAPKIEHCRREKCFLCNTLQVGVCRRTGVGYKIVCIICETK